MTTYTQTAGSADGTKYFQDVALTPANVKNGSLRLRLNTKRYPKVGQGTNKGIKFTSVPDAVSVSPSSASLGTVTVTNKALTSNVATLTVASHDFAVGDSITVAGVDATFNGVFTVTAKTATTVSYAKVNANVTSGVATGTIVHTTVTLNVTVTGQHLEKGAAVTFSGTGITVNSTRASGGKDRSLVANITIAAAATQSARNVTATNSDGGADTLTAAFTVSA